MTVPEPVIPVEACWIDNRVRLLCPICKDSYVHIKGVSYSDDGHNPEGTQMIGQVVRLHHRMPSQGRGAKVHIEFWCECNHQFGLLLQHHKGETFLYRTDPPRSQGNGS